MSEASRIYLDNQATTRVDPRVLEAMLPYFGEKYGNSASRHHLFGWEAEAAVRQSRETIAAALGAEASEIVFTSGATESNNLAIQGAALAYRPQGRHLVSCVTEHLSVLDALESLARRGWEVTLLPVDSKGSLDLDDLRAALRPDTVLVSVMHGNNEVGTIHPVEEIGAICREHGALYHCDATQTAGKEEICVDRWPVDLLSLSGHKMYGPKGVGCLFVRRRGRRVRLEPLLHGGGHERGLRSGTLPVPLIVGMARALELSLELRDEEQSRIAGLRDALEAELTSELDLVHVNGDRAARLAGNLNLSFEFVEGEALIHAMECVAASSGSACSSATLEPSHVLLAMKLSERLAHGSLRFSVGRFNTRAEVRAAAKRAIEAVRRLRGRSPVYQMTRDEAAAASPELTENSLQS